MHPHTTQTNEALNNSQAGLTPKSKSFHESKSFHYRHAIVIGTHNWGFRKYWSVVFNTLGVEYTQSFVNHLEMTDKRKLYWKTHHSKQEVKRRRGYKQDATQKKLLYENRTTEYASGIGLDIGHDVPARTSRSKPTTKRAKRTQCKCGSTTHLTSNSGECKFNKKNLAALNGSEMKAGDTTSAVDNIIEESTM